MRHNDLTDSSLWMVKRVYENSRFQGLDHDSADACVREKRIDLDGPAMNGIGSGFDGDSAAITVPPAITYP